MRQLPMRQKVDLAWRARRLYGSRRLHLKRYAYLGAEGCTPNATVIQEVSGTLGTTLGFYFVLSPAGAGLTYYWCAIRIIIRFVFCDFRQ